MIYIFGTRGNGQMQRFFEHDNFSFFEFNQEVRSNFSTYDEVRVWRESNGISTQFILIPKNCVMYNKVVIIKERSSEYKIINCNIVKIENDKFTIEYIKNGLPDYCVLTNPRIYNSWENAEKALNEFKEQRNMIRKSIISLNECRDKIEKEIIWRNI